MSEQELLDEKTFVELFSKSETEQLKLENQLFLEAKKLGVLSQFKKNYKAFKSKMAEKMVVDNSLNLPKCNYDIQNYDTGKYIVTINGIIDSKTDYKFSYIPILPVERYINQDTGKEKVKIIFYKENKWQEKIVNRSQLSVAQKLLALSDYGLDITSENVRYYVNYFNEILNRNDIKKLQSVSHIGWQDDNFIPYDTKGIFDGEEDFSSIYNAISKKGNYEKWKTVVKELRKEKVMKIIMAVSLASPLLEKLGIQPYTVNLWSAMSGSGKTLTCMTAMSIWGNPGEGALRFSSNNTQNFYVAVASFMHNITCYFDELQIVKNSKEFKRESLIMDLCNGTERGRLTKNSQTKEIKTWNNNFLFTNNDKLVRENAGEQVYNRVIDIEIDKNIVGDHPVEIAKIIRNNYGYAGIDYIKYIKEIGFDTIFDRYKQIYEEILEKAPATEKQANALATIVLADELANKCIFEDKQILKVDDILEYANDKNEIKTSIKAMNYIVSIISANRNKFNDDNRYGECWGAIKGKDTGKGIVNYCKFNIEILKKELEKGGFEFDTVKKDWAEMGFLYKNSQGKYIHQTTVAGVSGIFAIFVLN